MPWYKIVWSWIWDFIKPVAVALMKDGGEHLATIAMIIVKELSASNLSNAEKREQAVVKLTARVIQEGWKFGESAIRIVIEMAVQKMKAEESN